MFWADHSSMGRIKHHTLSAEHVSCRNRHAHPTAVQVVEVYHRSQSCSQRSEVERGRHIAGAGAPARI